MDKPLCEKKLPSKLQELRPDYFCCPVLKDTSSRNLTSKYQRCYLVIVAVTKKNAPADDLYVPNYCDLSVLKSG